jgi:Flp pilus assembly protein TadD
MLPATKVLTIKKWRRPMPGLAWAFLGAMLLAGCKPSGPGSLLKGEKLIHEGRYGEAIGQLTTATQLLPQNAQAWNHLGLAYHQSGQPAPAAQAYVQAIKLDRTLAAPRFNLGCLQLEQGNYAAAGDTLGSYCVLQPQSVEGWTKLAAAQWRARRLTDAERSFSQAVKLSPRHPEALNGLGVIQVERKRPREAYQYFSAVLFEQPAYRPALLNQAIIAHSYLNNHALALAKYREYLALRPAPAEAAPVHEIARLLDLELNPAPAPMLGNVKPSGAALTNKMAAVTNRSGATTNLVSTAPPGTNRLAPAVGTAQTSPATNLAKVNLPPIDSSPRIEVVRLPDEPTFKPAQDLPPATSSKSDAPPVSAVRPNPVITLPPEPGSPPLREPEKPGFFDRLNPVTWFRSKPKAPPSRSPRPAAPAVITLSTNGESLPEPVAPPPPAVYPRYSYQSPAKPGGGRRLEAEHYFAQGIQAQKQRRLAAAIEAYQEATRLDPGYFEAQYNLGLAAYETEDWPRSLKAYELALALDPASLDARYNFALALQAANYPRDAALELEKILSAAPDEARAHLTLAVLYAQKLSQPQLAREHYLKVLKVDPRHPQAAAIRYWLANNP